MTIQAAATKGLAPIPGQTPADARSLAMIVALTSEVSVLRARLDTMERLMTAAGVLAPGAIESFAPDQAAQEERDAQRQRTLAKVFRSLSDLAKAEQRA